MKPLDSVQIGVTSLDSAKKNMEGKNIFFSNDSILGKPSVIGYEKKFRWAWMATQLNTFICVSDFDGHEVNNKVMEEYLNESYDYAKKHYSGWPKGLQSGLGVISIIISSNLGNDVIEYCHKLSSGKKWAGFTIPVVIDANNGKVHSFDKNPMWGRIYYPHFRAMIDELTK